MNKLLISLAVSMALLSAGPSVAQQSPASANDSSSYSTPAASTQNANYSDAELKQFIEAQEGITKVRKEYIKKIEAADSQEKAQKLQMEANDQMVSVIEGAGMNIPSYNAIATAYSSQPEVRRRVEALM